MECRVSGQAAAGHGAVYGTCIRCGRASVLVDGRLCPSCYLEVYGLGRAPERLELTYCPRCGSIRLGGRWLPPPEGGLEEALAILFEQRFRPGEAVEEYRVAGVELDEDGGYAVFRVEGRLSGDEEARVVEYRVPVTLRAQLCPSCHRKASGAPTAIVQIRGRSGRLEEDERLAVEEQLARLGPGIADAIISVDEVREGLDIKMIDQGAARMLAGKLHRSLGALVKESYKLIGQRRDGRRVYRLTLSVRLPGFTEGSLVGYRGRLARVRRLRGGRVELEVLGGGSALLRVDDAWRLIDPEPVFEEERTVMVAAAPPGWIHLQEVEGSYSYLELRRDEVIVEGEPREGRVGRLLKYGGRYYLLV